MAMTINKLLENGTIKRGDRGMIVRVNDIHFREDFNPREEGTRLHDKIEADARYTLENGIGNMPQLKVEPREEGGVWMVEGHCRTRNVRRAIELGAKLEHPKFGGVWLPIMPFMGDDLDRDAEIIKSQDVLHLTPLETMVVIERMHNKPSKPSPALIARKTGMTRQYVDQLLIVATKGADVHDMIRRGEVTVDIAAGMIRTHGEETAAVLAVELEKAQSMGKKKVTKGTMAGPALPRAVVNDITTNIRGVMKSLPQDARETLELYRVEKIEDGDTPVAIPVRQLLALLMCSEEIERVQEEQARKAEAAAEKAKAKQALDGSADGDDQEHEAEAA